MNEYNLGWIKLYRKMQHHWLYKEKRIFSRFEAWLDILLNVQHEDEPQKIVIRNQILIVNRGESIRSLETWATRWRWSKSKVRRFFEMLQKENMIEYSSETQTTRLNVLNYDNYQSMRNANETQMKRKRNANRHADETQTKRKPTQLNVLNYDNYQSMRNADETQMKRKRNADETQMAPDKNDKNEKNNILLQFFISLLPEKLKRLESLPVAYEKFMEMRSEIRKPLNERIVKKNVKQLEGFRDPVYALKMSTDNEYQGLFDKMPEKWKPKDTNYGFKQADMDYSKDTF